MIIYSYQASNNYTDLKETSKQSLTKFTRQEKK
jgi:hypothetical protein